MLRKSVLITLISSAALGVAASDASAKGAMGFAHVGGLSSAASHYTPSFRPVFNPHPGIKDVGYGRSYLQKPAATFQIKPKITTPYVNPNAAVQIKPNYGGSLKPLPVPPIAAATNHPGTGVVMPPSSPATPASPGSPITPPVHWPHNPGPYGTPVISSGPVIEAVPAAAEVAMPAAPVVNTATVTAGPVARTPDTCTCLTKQYTAAGAVVFMDRCTNEVAVSAPQQTGGLIPR
jgi:hypothetical protein